MKKEDKKKVEDIKEKTKEVVEDVKEESKKAIDKIKDKIAEVKVNAEENKDFKRYSVRVKRVNSKMFNIEKHLFAVLDQEELTLTYRDNDDYAINEMLEIGPQMYQVASIGAEKIMFPLMVDGEEHEVECRVAKLSVVDKVADKEEE